MVAESIAVEYFPDSRTQNSCQEHQLACEVSRIEFQNQQINQFAHNTNNSQQQQQQQQQQQNHLRRSQYELMDVDGSNVNQQVDGGDHGTFSGGRRSCSTNVYQASIAVTSNDAPPPQLSGQTGGFRFAGKLAGVMCPEMEQQINQALSGYQSTNQHSQDQYPAEIQNQLSQQAKSLELSELIKCAGVNTHNIHSQIFDIEELQLEDEIGHGIFARVHQGSWNGQTVAVKSMPHATMHAQDPQVIHECILSTSLMHPNILQFYGYLSGNLRHIDPHRKFPDNCFKKFAPQFEGDYFETYLMSEFCDCGNVLDALLDGFFFLEGQLDIQRVLTVAGDVARGLSYLHRRNIVHGDLKSQNILLKQSQSSREGFVAKIADFGISRAFNSPPKHLQNLIGTVAYMPIETIENSVMSFQTDIFAFGIFLWEILSGEEAFSQCSTHKELLEVKKLFCGNAAQDEIWNLYLPLKDSWPQQLRHVIRSCCCSDENLRPTIKSVLNELQHISKQF